jgi:hypothetical protein
MQPPTSNPPSKLILRAFDCLAQATEVKSRLEQLIETSGLFNTSFLNGEFSSDSRIGGLDQHGDIIVRHRRGRKKHELTIEHRAGDEPLVAEIIKSFGNTLTARPAPETPGLKRPRGMAYFFEMIQGNPLKSKVLVADAVVEAAHDLNFDDYRAARRQLDFLARLRFIRSRYHSQSKETQTAYHMAQVNHPDPKVCLHEGEKVFLRNQIVVKPDKGGPHMMMHFTRLPKGKILVGWVEETPF